MLRKALFLAILFSATIVAAQDYSYILSPTVIDGNAGNAELPAGWEEQVRAEVGGEITATLGPRLTTLSVDRLLKEDDRVLVLIPTITTVRDFKEIIVGSITRHNLIVMGHLQVVDPWSNFTIASIPRLVEASTDVGFAESGQEDALVADAYRHASSQWAKDVSSRDRRHGNFIHRPRRGITLPKVVPTQSRWLTLGGQQSTTGRRHRFP